MADETRRLRPGELQADEASFAAIQDIADYTPANASYTVAKIQTLKNGMDEAVRKETQAEAAAKAARDAATKAEWEFHKAVIAARQQVVAQYGDDSNEAQAVGLTKKSERAKPTAKKAAGTASK
jgi:glutathione peroxidase-family protein